VDSRHKTMDGFRHVAQSGTRCSIFLMSMLFLHHSSSATGKPQYKDLLYSISFALSLLQLAFLPKVKVLPPFKGQFQRKPL